MDCVFCKIIQGEIPSYKIYEDNKILIFLDINPNDIGHMLIVPKEHVVDLLSIDNDMLGLILDKARDMAHLLEEKLKISGFTLVQNNGIAQDVKHFHMHLIPKYNKKVKLSIEEVYNLLTK